MILPPFDELVSQPYAARFLSAAIAKGQTNHAYLFVGPLGSGKTEAAKLLTEALLCGRGTAAAAASTAATGTGTSAATAFGSGSAATGTSNVTTAAATGPGSDGDAENRDDCLRVRHGTHPDLHSVEPLGISGYLSEQIAEIIHDAALAPIRASRKIYLITRADLLKGTTANALLKTLEEPPDSVTFVLLARTREAVLPTLLSRCQVIAFRRVPETEAIQTVCERSGEQLANARIALAVCGGSVYRAVEFIRSSERRAARLEVLAVLERLDGADDLELLEAVKRLLVVFKAPLDAVRVEQELQLQRGRDYLGKGAQTRLEQQHKRELSNRERETVGEALDVIRSWLRDVLLLGTGYAAGTVAATAGAASAAATTAGTTAGTTATAVATAAVTGATGAEMPMEPGGARAPAPARCPQTTIVNHDHHYHIARVAQRVSQPRILAALAAVDAAQEQMQYNVAVQLALESMFLRIRAALAALCVSERSDD
jgi:DNA polymerase-3 subunit delta'